MRLIMMGTGPFAVPAFEKLLASSHEVLCLVTQPIRNRRPKAAVSPMREVAEKNGLPIFDPESINTEESKAELTRYEADLFVVADYGQILSREALGLSKLGGINIHGSLLPKYRGAAPVAWAIYHGEKETGVTIIQMTPRLDAGPTLGTVKTEIKEHETAGALEERLAKLGAVATLEAIERLEQGEIVPVDQNHQKASKARRLAKQDGVIDWSQSAQQIHLQIRAMQPWPKCYSFWHRPQGQPVRLILLSSEVLSNEKQPGTAKPGEILQANQEGLWIATGDHPLRILTVQPAGKRAMLAEEFLRGHALEEGQSFGPAT
ncbi:Methionyl-tRNA formyltransferase [Planctomycetales bacterium 10988]|nr:Methionyl-tRNA formyltransferase [Planctomycetales bacterium 10988]